MPTQYKIAVLVHEGEELASGTSEDLIGIQCNDTQHPQYSKAVKDGQCRLCRRAHLRLL